MVGGSPFRQMNDFQPFLELEAATANNSIDIVYRRQAESLLR